MIGLEECDWALYGGSFFAYLILDQCPLQIKLGQVCTTSGDNASGGGVSLCIKSTMKLLIGY
jgi:hypothetical protein